MRIRSKNCSRRGAVIDLDASALDTAIFASVPRLDPGEVLGQHWSSASQKKPHMPHQTWRSLIESRPFDSALLVASVQTQLVEE